MRIVAIVIFFSLLSVNTVSAQKSKPHFSTTTSVGVATGESQSALILETVNGLKFSNWFAGLGIGLDYYQYKTLPLFANARWYFGKEKSAFIFGSAGYNFPLYNKPGHELGYIERYYFTGGVYAEGGVAYSVALHKKSSLVFGIGYSYKELELYSSNKFCGIVGPCWEDHINYELNYGRIIVKMGFEF